MAATLSRKIESCLICDSRELHGLPGYERDHLVACDACSFVFSNMRPSREELDKVYSGYSRDAERTEATLQKMRRTVANLKNLSEARRVLDIGCGDGEFLSLFRDLGCQVYGTEYDARTEEVCRKKGIAMLPGGVIPLLDDSGLIESFDLVVFTEIIEHINNPLDVVRNISRLLRKGGILYITTPNFASLERRVLGPQWGMICYPEHISFYSPRTINHLMRKCGYQKLSLRTENVSIFRIVQFLNQRKLGARLTGGLDPERVAAAAQNAVQRRPGLVLAKKAINTALNATGAGTSLIAMYRRA
jgi:2-polyprenyl-3-methyl-5-hydroxy-6-metoxy-1,4-benzoquinol methylase